MMQESSISKLIKVLPDITPGIERSLFILQKDLSNSSLIVFHTHYQPEVVTEVENRAFEEDRLEKYVYAKTDYEWVSESDVPFHGIEKASAHIDLFSSLENNCLYFRINTPTTKNSLLGFLIFAKASAHSRLPVLKGGMDKSLQQLTAILIINTSRYILNDHEQREIEHRSFMMKTRATLDQLSQSKEAISKSKDLLAQGRITFIESMVSKLGNSLGSRFILSHDLTNAIMSFTGDLNELLSRIQDAARYAHELHHDLNNSVIKIEEYYVASFTPAQESGKTEPATTQVVGSLSRTMELLDKYEAAANFLERQGIKLTSTNVGKHCPTPISAPAISDSIKTHKVRILRLMHANPLRWPTIRSGFRPITRIMEENESMKELESA